MDTLPLVHWWSPADDEFLKEKRSDGWSAAQIGRAIGRSRSAVCGRAKRLGISVSGGGQSRSRKSEKTKRAKRIESGSNVFLGKRKIGVRIVRETPSEAPPSLELTTEQLTDRTCKYMAGDPLLDGTFCGHKTDDGSSYCTFHHSLVWRPVDMYRNTEMRDSR